MGRDIAVEEMQWWSDYVLGAAFGEGRHHWKSLSMLQAF